MSIHYLFLFFVLNFPVLIFLALIIPVLNTPCSSFRVHLSSCSTFRFPIGRIIILFIKSIESIETVFDELWEEHLSLLFSSSSSHIQTKKSNNIYLANFLYQKSRISFQMISYKLRDHWLVIVTTMFIKENGTRLHQLHGRHLVVRVQVD